MYIFPCRPLMIIALVYTLMSVIFYLMNGRSHLFSAASISHMLIVVILDLCTLLCIVVIDVQSILDTAIETMRGVTRAGEEAHKVKLYVLPRRMTDKFVNNGSAEESVGLTFR